ncbi:unnamed protein product [Bursaphelenchus okinawaensis]|uniref:Uncharacterized protein n=1 Tax=Bursaphelenchus okinawaensis TaxID=465554 RepID=A0A811JR29_9BILA|nr:unnamed protein product [Bursaphelenchus okinawaensis]CAG9078887.1 unnamed protein product [Bursaphelenchus okinawaensis]
MMENFCNGTSQGLQLQLDLLIRSRVSGPTTNRTSPSESQTESRAFFEFQLTRQVARTVPEGGYVLVLTRSGSTAQKSAEGASQPPTGETTKPCAIEESS